MKRNGDGEYCPAKSDVFVLIIVKASVPQHQILVDSEQGIRGGIGWERRRRARRRTRWLRCRHQGCTARPQDHVHREARGPRRHLPQRRLYPFQGMSESSFHNLLDLLISFCIYVFSSCFSYWFRNFVICFNLVINFCFGFVD